jgi:hypothetical protein
MRVVLGTVAALTWSAVAWAQDQAAPVPDKSDRLRVMVCLFSDWVETIPLLWDDGRAELLGPDALFTDVAVEGSRISIWWRSDGDLLQIANDQSIRIRNGELRTGDCQDATDAWNGVLELVLPAGVAASDMPILDDHMRRCFDLIERHLLIASGLPPSGGPGSVLVHDGLGRCGWGGRRSGSGW